MLNIFTIVLNGEPYIRRHLAVFERLRVPWRWSIAHGIADPVADTSWCQRLDRVKPDETWDYLQRIAHERADRITLQHQDRWPGKVAMVNAAIDAFSTPGILLEVDSDECWKTEQLETLLRLFTAYPDCDAAYFFCRFFVGPRRVVTQPGAYGNNPAYEWLRAWRWSPGRRFTSHEPPQLQGQRTAMAHGITAAAGLVFDHFAYAQPAAVAFKELYYGYAGALDGWSRLNAQPGPADLKDYLPWVKSSVISYLLP